MILPIQAKGQKIAIIGGGMSGLSAGYLLGQQHHVTLYESASCEGLGVRSMKVKDVNYKFHWLDIPLRVCRENYYKNLCRMYKHIGAETETVAVSQTIMKSCKSVIFSMGTALLNMRQFLPLFFNRKHWRTAYHCAKFLLLTNYHLLVRSAHLKTITFGEYLDQHISREFFEEYMYPSCNIVLSCSRSSLEAYPAHIVLSILLATSSPIGQPIIKLTGGINTIIPLLIKNIQTLRFNSRIQRASFNPATGKVLVTDDTGETLLYDQVVFATEAEVVPFIVSDMSPEDVSVFRYFKYEEVDIVIHSNTEQCLSDNQTYWSLLNIINSPDRDTLPQISLLMNRFINAPMSEYFVQTLNPSPELLKTALIINQIRMKRVIFDIKLEENLARLDAIQGKNHLWYCGSYSVYGSNLLEECLVSAMKIAKHFNAPIPWER